jgi:hypothetical protein
MVVQHYFIDPDVDADPYGEDAKSKVRQERRSSACFMCVTGLV